MDDIWPATRPPSRAVSIGVSAALVVLWGAIRLVLVETVMFPLTYAIPLLVCIWTRDRVALWSMAVIFIGFHTAKLFWFLPAGTLSGPELWANYLATVSNVSVAAVAIRGVIGLREGLERELARTRAQAEELRAQGEELAEQNEELAAQAEELSQQGEELASQNEELQSQTEEIGALNEALERRETLLQTLLETARLSGAESTALQHIAAAAPDLLGGVPAAVAVYEQESSGLQIRALAPARSIAAGSVLEAPVDDFVNLVLHQNRTASLNDVSLRPDLSLARLAGHTPFRAALCAPIQFGGTAFGAFAIYSAREHDWTDEEFRIAEWLAAQAGRVLQALRVQSDLREADRRKSEFLATLSHELRNPLAPIRFALKMIEPGNGRDANALRIMQRQVQQLVRLVDDLLDATRLSSNKVQVRKTRMDLVPVVQQAIEAARPDIEAACHAIDVALPAEPVWLDADPDRVAQVVANLLTNATRYTPAGGRIAVAVSASDGEAVLSVSDTGVGLDREDLERVFDMFTQVGGPGSGGLGIGLALVRGIVELHGGHVEARSEGRGRGSEFRVVLPLAARAPAETTAGEEVLAFARPCRVLVVDDNTDSAEMMGTLLEMYGHTVRIAHDGESALALAREFSPDAALLDIGLPGLNGYELARRFRQDEGTRRMRLIALTGWGQEGDRIRATDAGFDAHLTKPSEPDVILAAIGATDPV